MAASVKELEVICWEDLGCEAVRRLEVQDFPLTVILDAHGGDLYQSGPAAYQAMPLHCHTCKYFTRKAPVLQEVSGIFG